MLRRLVLTAAVSAAALSTVAPAAHARPLPPPAAHTRPLPTPEDRLTITVEGVGPGADGTYRLLCHPATGDHPRPRTACAQLDKRTVWGKDPFAPVPRGTMCTMQYGGPGTAHIKGIWAGRPVDARFDRGNGCEMARWDALVPVLPATRSTRVL
ncbi:SSI family serine proteinase inhibitor [Streptomyces sp. NPDC002004]